MGLESLVFHNPEPLAEGGSAVVDITWGHAQYICDDSHRAVYTDQDIQVQILLCQVWIL